MRGLWLEGKRLAFRDDLAEPPRADGEAVVRVRLAGICGTDLELRRGYYPFTGVPGHEFVGVVESLCGLYLGESLGQIGIFVMFILVLLFRPSGLFGERA